MSNEEKVLNEEKGQTAAEETQAEEQTVEEAVDEAVEEAFADEPKAEEKKEEDESLQTQFLRLTADFQNYKRRTEKEKSDIYAYANEKFALQVLDVIDNFERAMDAANPEDKFAEGMQLILKQLQDVLTKNNVEEIKALGEDFDPAFHNAVMTEESSEYESGKVSKVYQKGYMLNKKVIRPAMVSVAQ